MSSGIYAIECIANGKHYVGSATNLAARWRGHLKSMKSGRNANVKLRNAFLKHGEANFVFRPLLLCEKRDLLFYEERAIAAFDAVDGGYNCRRVPYSNLGLRLPMSEETRKKIAAAKRGKKRGPSPLRGTKRSPESCRKMSATKRTRFKRYELDGRAMCLSDWADRIGITTRALGNRIKRGWPLSRALTERSRGY